MSNEEANFLFSSSPNQLSICIDNYNGNLNSAIQTRTIGSFSSLNGMKDFWPHWEWLFVSVDNSPGYGIQSVKTGYYLNGSTNGSSGNQVHATAKGSSLSSSQMWEFGDVGSVTIEGVKFRINYIQNMASNQYLQYPNTQNGQAITTVSDLGDQCYWIVVSVEDLPSENASVGALNAVVTTNFLKKEDDLKSDEKEKEMGLVKYEKDMKRKDSNATGYDLKGLSNVLAMYESMVPNKTDRILMAELAHSKRFDTLVKYFDHLNLNKDIHFKAEAVVNHVALHTHGKGFGVLGNGNGGSGGGDITYYATVSLQNNSGGNMSVINNSETLSSWRSGQGNVPSSINNGITSNTWQTQSKDPGDDTSGHVRYTFTVGSMQYKVNIEWAIDSAGNTSTDGTWVKQKGSTGGWNKNQTYSTNVANSCGSPTVSNDTATFAFTVGAPP